MMACSSSSFKVRIKAFSQLGQEVKRTAEKCNMTADRFSAGKTGDGLVYNCLENRSGQILLGCTVVDQRLDVSFGKYTAAGCDRVERFVILSHIRSDRWHLSEAGKPSGR